MAPLPKRKISKARKNRRRAHDHLTKPSMSVCPKCKRMKRPHFKCQFCGYYGPELKSAGTKKLVSPEKKTQVASVPKAPKTDENKK